MSSDPYLVFGSPLIEREAFEAVAKTLESSWIGTGPRVHEFEAAFAKYVGASHAIATSSCTSALHLAMVASGVGPGDEVITTPMTFCATVNAIIHTGATPVFADCQRGTMNIDPEAVAAAVTPRTRAILPVHFAGRPADLDALGAIARKQDLRIIEDAAHAIETEYRGRKVGAIGDLTCFSFYVTKNMTTGEGGMVTTNDAALAAKMKVFGLHGMSADAWSRFSDNGYRHYDVVYPGFKYNLTDIAASLGLSQLPKLAEWSRRRQVVWDRYQDAFADLPITRPADPEPDTVHALHLYTIKIKDGAKVTRDEFLREMHKRGIGTGVHYRAVHTMPYYRDRWNLKPEQFPNAYYIGERTVSLPLTPKLTDHDVDRVIKAVRDILA